MFAGRLGWVWDVAHQFGNDIQQVIAQAQATGCVGVLIKSNDEARRWAQASKETVDALHAANLKAIFWGYAYGAVDAFVLAAVRVVEETGCDGYCVDAEAELRDAGTAGELARELRAALPDFPLAVAPLPVMRFHRGLDFPVWAEQRYTLAPQLYWEDLGGDVPGKYGDLEVLFAQWRTAFPDADFAPVAQAYGPVTAEEFAHFGRLCQQYGAIGWSFWRLDTADPAMLEAANA